MSNDIRAEKLRDSLRRFVGKDATSYTMAGVVSDIDETAFTCTVTKANGAVLEDVQLKALKEITTGVVCIPKADSWVHIIQIGEPDYLVIACEEIDKLLVTIGGETLEVTKDGHVFDKGNNGGMVIVQKLVNKINALESKLNDVISALNTHTHPTAGTGAPSTPTPIPGKIPTTPLSNKTQVADLENTKVRH